MLLGLMFCKKYTFQRYLFVVVIVTGVAVFQFYEPKTPKKSERSENDGDLSETMAQLLGLGLLGFSLTADGVLGAIQEKMR